MSPITADDLVDKLSWLTVHFFDGDFGMADHNVSLGQQTLGDGRVSVHNVTKLNLLLSKLFLNINIFKANVCAIFEAKVSYRISLCPYACIWIYTPPPSKHHYHPTKDEGLNKSSNLRHYLLILVSLKTFFPAYHLRL